MPRARLRIHGPESADIGTVPAERYRLTVRGWRDVAHWPALQDVTAPRRSGWPNAAARVVLTVRRRRFVRLERDVTRVDPLDRDNYPA